ncbi:MAG: hypothetical protein ABIU85_07135, partial [Methylotenera sp.]
TANVPSGRSQRANAGLASELAPPAAAPDIVGWLAQPLTEITESNNDNPTVYFWNIMESPS